MLVLFCYLLMHLLQGMFSMTCLAQSLGILGPVPRNKRDQMVINLYVFGDSIVESGRKTHHESGMKGHHRPYGIECMWIGSARFTNGRTIPEIIASLIKVRPPVSVDEVDNEPQRGVNYASASAGILPETGTALGKNFCLEKQIGSFRETVQNKLKGQFQSTQELSKYLSNSVYLINIGSSDYIHNYLQPDYYNSSRLYNGEAFAELLIKELGNQLKGLYNLGARKIVIFQIGPLGCFPHVINKLKPSSRCAEDVNSLVSIFNDKLDAKIKQLSEKLDGSTFVTARTFSLMKTMIENPTNYGFAETRWPCCPTEKNGTGLCKETKIQVVSPAALARIIPPPAENQWISQSQFLCEDIPPPDTLLNRAQAGTGKPREDLCEYRKIYLFFDELHLTEAADRIIANKCFTSSDGICSPFGIDHLDVK